ncbi:hypothetical protein Aph01nite_80800 [Acrocarpospora phusangensis]|uniref:Lipopolysaccharide assembly protein A domain-containing protein n=1 Tax=Acrocarpospora phusangensis TaxID=1070424 RepID=A0A919QP16_9ACTN|nr:hypothetical protein [Acrocarpospora phusangensis]GIH29770.1 hypothetical protein Aph01nite_80800 [Acrocarpospora phusangensis]
MVLLGLLLIVVAVAAFYEMSMLDNTLSTNVSVLDWTFSLTPLELFLAGAATAAAFLVGLALMFSGARRSALRRRRRRDERLAERDRVSRLESEKRDLEKRLDTAAVDRDHDGVDDRDQRTVPAQARTEDAAFDPDRDTDGTRSFERITPDSDRLVAGGRHAHRPDETR